MSRTFKDKPDKLNWPYLEPYERPLSKKKKDTEWRWWKNTPSWWNRMFHTKPRRRKIKLWERDVVKVTDVELLEIVDKPNDTNKPHIYYW